jgi:hypothetical protein
MVACPVNDWLCPYFENGDCTLENCEQECDAFYGLKMQEEEIKQYTLDDLGNNWYNRLTAICGLSFLRCWTSKKFMLTFRANRVY